MKLSQDEAEYAKLLATIAGRRRNAHVAKVFHLKHQNTLGGTIIANFMQKYCSIQVLEDSKVDKLRDAVGAIA